MTTPLWCLVATAFLPYALSILGGYFRQRQFGRVDNKNPRAQEAALEGVGARVQAAQENAWEALPFFAVAVFVAHLAGADPGPSATASLLFLATRVLHPVFYVADLDLLRSGTFLVGLASCVWLVALAAGA
jgi:uncharacterized MAPEG superfamily protein